MKIIREIFQPAPQILYLEPSFGCNYRCLFCIHGSGHQIEVTHLGPGLFGNLKPLIETVNHIHMTGLGEPFLNPNLLDYLSYFREQGKSYYINTNGSLIEDAHIDLLTTSASELSISLDAGDCETYDTIRQPGKWNTIISGLKRVAQIKTGRRTRHPLLYLTFHINVLNLISLKKVPQLARDLGIDAVKFSWTMLPETYRAGSIFKHQDAVNDILRDVSAQLREIGVHVTSGAIFDKHVRDCWVFSPMAFVGAGGQVAACCNRWLTIGHVRENDFPDIWNGMPRRQIALAIVNGKSEGGCQDCPQILGVDYGKNEQDFLKPMSQEATILAEKAKSVEKLQSLQGLDDAFRYGVTALLGGELHAAVNTFSALDVKYPDFFEIKNNLAVAHYQLGNREKCKELLDAIAGIPHNSRLLQDNRDSFEQSREVLETEAQRTRGSQS